MEKKIITAREIFQDATTAFRAERSFIFKASLLGIFLPMTILGFVLDESGISTASRLRDSFFAGSPQAKEFTAYLAQVLPYFFVTLVVMLAILLVIMASYYVILGRLIATRHPNPAFREEGRSLDIAWKVAPSLLAFLFLVSVASVVAQIAMIPAVFLMCLATMFPVLQFAEGYGAFRALWHAVTIRYTQVGRVSGWNIFFNLISIGAFCYTVFILFAFLGEALLFADSWLPVPRDLWLVTFPGTNLGIVYIIVSLIENAMFAGVAVALALLTSSLYFRAAIQHRENKLLAMA